MKASVRYIHSPDADWQLALVAGHVRDGLALQVIAGPDNGMGEESFDLIVCTPSWLAAEVADSGPHFARHVLVVPEMDPIAIDRALRDRFESEAGTDWHDLAVKLSRWGHWEFEDYENRDPRGGSAIAGRSE